MKKRILTTDTRGGTISSYNEYGELIEKAKPNNYHLKVTYGKETKEEKALLKRLKRST